MRSGSQQRCRHCGSEEVKMNRANDTIQCETCDRILEERYNDFRTTTVLLDRDSPFPIVTQDGLSKYKFEEGQIANDPFHSTGFITAFSQTNLQPMGAFTLTARTFPGELAELERILGDMGVDAPEGIAKAAGGAAKGVAGESSSVSDSSVKRILTAYFLVQELGDVLDVHMDHCDEAMRIFKSHMDSKAGASASGDNINLLAVAAIALAQLDSGLQVDLSELSQASDMSVEEIENAIKTARTAQEGNSSIQETTSSPISSYMPRFCSLLGMSGATEQLALRMGQNAIQNGVCARRNPTSVAAAVIYLAFNLEDQKKTQTEVCKVTGLTEVTLRKVYKELLAEHGQIIPADYTPKVSLKRLLPSGGVATNRAAETSSESQQNRVGSSTSNFATVQGDFDGGANAMMLQQLMQAMAQALPQGQPGQLGATPELSMQQAQQTLANLAASFSGVAGASIAPAQAQESWREDMNSQDSQQRAKGSGGTQAQASLFARQYETLKQAGQQQGVSKKT